MTRNRMEFSPYLLPLGTEFTLGKCRWRLIAMDAEHPDFMTFREVSVGAHTPDRVFNPSEVQDLYDRGVVFCAPLRCVEVAPCPPSSR